MSIDEAWVVVVEVLIELGMGTAGTVADVARNAGCAPDEVLAACHYWQAYWPAWQCGALAQVLRVLRPGKRPEELPWPPPDQRWLRQQSRIEQEQRRRAAGAQWQAAAEAAAAEKERMQQLEAKFGFQLNQMDEGTFQQLVRQYAADEASFLNPRTWRASPMIRSVLLEAMEAEDG